MKFKRATQLPDIVICTPEKYLDERGYFFESYNSYHLSKFLEKEVEHVKQVNMSVSKINTIRGLHYQLNTPQAKYVTCIKGEILDVVVDIRRNSPTFKQRCTFRLTSDDNIGVYIPEGFAHGFRARSDDAEVMYGCSEYYNFLDSFIINPFDTEIGIIWGIEKDKAIMSEKDRYAPTLEHMIKNNNLPI